MHKGQDFFQNATLVGWLSYFQLMRIDMYFLFFNLFPGKSTHCPAKPEQLSDQISML